MALDLKYKDAKVTVASRDFSQAAFTDNSGAWVYQESKFKPILREMKNELRNIQNEYAEIHTLYKHMYEHGDSDGGKLDDNDGFCARIKKYKNRSEKRAQISQTRREELSSIVDEVDAQTKDYGTVTESEINSGSAIDKVDDEN